MILLLIALIVLACVSIGLIQAGYKKDMPWPVFTGMLMAVTTGIILAVYCCIGVDYIAAGYKAKILNREYSTHYTASEILFAEDVINTIREIDRTRIEINGNVLNEKLGTGLKPLK